MTQAKIWNASEDGNPQPVRSVLVDFDAGVPEDAYVSRHARAATPDGRRRRPM